MTEEKLDTILSDIEGITYMEWSMISKLVERELSIQVDKYSRTVTFNDTGAIKNYIKTTAIFEHERILD